MQNSNQTQFVSVKERNSHCLFDSAVISNFTEKMLCPEYWNSINAVTGTAQGRGTTWFVNYSDNSNAEHAWVLRHYYRGGLIGKFNKDLYCFTGIDNTRAAREFSLLQHMQRLQLPAPAPIAYRVTSHGLLYRADLLSSCIQNAQDLVGVLTKENLTDDTWYFIGETIKRFHQHDIYHHDLNSHNILLDNKGQVFVIDFDRGEIRQNTDGEWKKSNMSRLKRSFLKELKQLPIFHFNDKNWQSLMAGYNKTSN